MRRNHIISLLLIVIMMFSLIISGCGSVKLSKTYDESPLTMYVGLGNGSNYDLKLQKMIHDDLGIDVEFVYSSLMDTSIEMIARIKNNDLPADIVITASKTSEEYQEKAFCNLADVSTIADSFSPVERDRFSIGSSVYQLPFTSKLIGIEYNKTLMDEMGWSVPNNFEDMVNLKALADEAGIKFAVSGGIATGHGFNYLFHLMGADYLSTVDGSTWYNNFLKGKVDTKEFEAASEYFKKYCEAGLFGSYHTADWNSKYEFSKERALFYYNITNDISSYDGFQYTRDGKIVGAEYDEAGNIVLKEDPDGNAVLINDEYVLYDETNEQMTGLERYTIPGAVVLHDKYASMPWISEDGSTNVFTIYNCMYLALNKNLMNEDQTHKLEQAVEILKYMTTEKATDLFSSTAADGYVAVNGYLMDDSRLYAEYKDAISGGYTQYWYYNDFDNDTIVNVGGAVNKFICGDADTDIHSIMTELDNNWNSELNNTEETTATIPETLDYEKSASVLAAAGTYSLSKALKDAGINDSIDLSIVPYTTDIKELPVFIAPTGITQSKFYKGQFYPSSVRTYINAGQDTVYAIEMTGKEVSDILDSGYSLKKDHDVDKTFPYVAISKDGSEIDSGSTYLVCVAPKSITSDQLNYFEEHGKVLSADGKPIEANLQEGLLMYAEENGVISSDNLILK